MTTRTLLPDAQWAVLNVLDRRVLVGTAGRDPGPSARAWYPLAECLDRAGAEVSHLVALEAEKLIEAAVPGGRAVDVASPPRGTRVALTTAGRRWVDDDPHNRVVTAAFAGAREIHKAVRDYDLTADAIAACHSAGLVSVTWRVTGREVSVPLPAGLVEEMCKTGPSWRGDQAVLLSLTRRGRRVAGAGA